MDTAAGTGEDADFCTCMLGYICRGIQCDMATAHLILDNTFLTKHPEISDN